MAHDHDNFCEGLDEISQNHGDLIRSIFEAVHDADDTADFQKITSEIHGIMDGLQACYHQLASLLRYADERETEIELQFAAEVRATIRQLPLYIAPTPKVACVKCRGTGVHNAKTCCTCSGKGVVEPLPRSRTGA